MDILRDTEYWTVIQKLLKESFITTQQIDLFFVQNKTLTEFQDFVKDAYCLFLKQQLMEKEIYLSIQKVKIDHDIFRVNKEIDRLDWTKKRDSVLKEYEEYLRSIEECSRCHKMINRIQDQLFKC